MKISKSLSVGDLSFKYAPRHPPAISFIVSRRYGNAVARNLFKRRCRALFQNKFIQSGSSVALIVRPNKKEISFSDINFAFKGLCEKVCV